MRYDTAAQSRSNFHFSASRNLQTDEAAQPVALASMSQSTVSLRHIVSVEVEFSTKQVLVT